MKRLIFICVLFFLTLYCKAQIVGTKREDFKIGFVDKKGNWIVKPQYDSGTIWKGNYGKIEKNDSVGLIDETGNIVLPCMYKRVDVFEGFVYVTDHEDRNGVYHFGRKELIVPCIYKEIWRNYNDDPYFIVTDFNNHSGVFSYVENKYLIPCKFKHVKFNSYSSSDFTYWEVTDDNDNHGTFSVDEQKMIVPCEYSEIWHYYEENCWYVTKKEGFKGRLNNDGSVRIPCIYASIRYAAENVYLVNKGGKEVNKKIVGGKWGYFANGEEIIPCKYDNATPFTSGVAQVTLDGQVSLIKNPLDNLSNTEIASGGLTKKTKELVTSRYPAPNSDVDKDIPISKQKNKNLFAFIIANENYPEAPVPFSLNDGRMFREYCSKTLGLPDENISMYEDATFGNIIAAVEKMKSVAEVFEGDASILFYYAGHGFPDDKQSTAYLLPIDGNASDITVTGYSLAKLYREISALNLKSAIVFLDACFSGAKREDEMLASSRGIAIKVQEEAPQGNMVVFTAAQGDETAHQLEDKGHGLFTYYLLKELQQTGGNVTLGDLTDFVSKQVKRQSVVINNKKQTPTVIPSTAVVNVWREMNIK